MEGGALIQVAEEVHCNIGPANLDMQVAHIHDSLEAVDAGEAGMDLIQVHDREVVVVAGFHMEEFENIRAHLAAEVVGKWRLEDEMCLVCSLGPAAVENWFFESDEVAQQKEMSSYRCFFHPGN